MTGDARARRAAFATELALLIEVIRADGEIRDEEIAALRRIAAERGVAFDAAELRDRMAREPRAADLPDPRGMSRARRNAIVRHMIEVALADGQLHAAERDLIRRASERYLLAAPETPVRVA